MIKGTIQQEDITLVNTYAANKGAPIYVKHLYIYDVHKERNQQ